MQATKIESLEEEGFDFPKPMMKRQSSVGVEANIPVNPILSGALEATRLLPYIDALHLMLGSGCVDTAHSDANRAIDLLRRSKSLESCHEPLRLLSKAGRKSAPTTLYRLAYEMAASRPRSVLKP
ncbi:MAG: hypothetical protein QW057_07710 [Candidatus Bathyarchaeia archaeon]